MQALLALHRAGKLAYTVSQNVDGLHLRSGLPRAALAELHGNCFAERCARCGREYVRDFEMETVGFRYTGRKCSDCGGRLKDHILDWCATGSGGGAAPRLRAFLLSCPHAQWSRHFRPLQACSGSDRQAYCTG